MAKGKRLGENLYYTIRKKQILSVTCFEWAFKLICLLAEPLFSAFWELSREPANLYLAT